MEDIKKPIEGEPKKEEPKQEDYSYAVELANQVKDLKSQIELSQKTIEELKAVNGALMTNKPLTQQEEKQEEKQEDKEQSLINKYFTRRSRK